MNTPYAPYIVIYPGFGFESGLSFIMDELLEQLSQDQLRKIVHSFVIKFGSDAVDILNQEMDHISEGIDRDGIVLNSHSHCFM